MVLLLIVFFGVCSGETLIDLSHDVAVDSIRWPTHPPVKYSTITKGYVAPGLWVESNYIGFSEHTSTHLDAPSHFKKDAWPVEQIPLDHLIGPAIVIDITKKVEENHLATLDTKYVKNWVLQYGPIPNNSIVFVRTGWGKKYGNYLEYFGTSVANDTSNLIFPGVHVEAAALLASYKYGPLQAVVGVGIDTASLDPGNSLDFKTHVELSRHNIYLLENVANLEKLPVTGAEVTVMPIKIRGGSGGPARILARIPSSCAASSAVNAGLLLLALVLQRLN